MFWGVRSQQVPVYVHTLSAQLWFYFLFAIIAEKVDKRILYILIQSAFCDGNNTGIGMKSS